MADDKKFGDKSLPHIEGLIDDREEDMMESIDAAFDSIILSDDAEVEPNYLSIDHFNQDLEDATRGEVQLLFERILLQYLDPLKTFINSILKGDMSSTVIDGFRGIMEPLLEATEKLGITALFDLFDNMYVLLGNVEGMTAPVPYRIIRPFADTYIKIVENISEEVREEYFSDVRYKRNSNGLLEEFRKIKYIGPQRLQRLYAAGLTTIEAVEGASAIDIAVTTGISLELADQVKLVAEDYRDRLEREKIDKIAALSKDLLGELRSLRHERSNRVLSETRPLLLTLDEEIRSELEYLQTLFGQRERRRPAR